MRGRSVLARLLPLAPKSIVRSVARRYIAGEELGDALQVIRELNRSGIRGTIDVLGEFVERLGQTEAARSTDLAILDGIAAARINANLSLKLTTLGLQLDFERCCESVTAILSHAKALGNFVRLDMEDSSCTSLTLELYRRMRAMGFANVGIVLQACLRRSAADIDELPSEGLNVRLCKGIYLEPPAIAFQEREEIQANFSRLLRQLLERGAYTAIATHDDVLIEDALALIAQSDLPKERHEFQMLLGVREAKRTALVRAGHGMRVYVPYGKDWYGYSMRRLQENPRIALHIAKALAGL
jgi:proline dehydrogenase